jgi:hypothetical protein
VAATRRVHSWTVYSAVALGRARFASVANLLLGGPWVESLEDELPVAYDFLCDLYLETGREDVQRTAEFLGHCLSSGVEAAAAFEIEDASAPATAQDWVVIEKDTTCV